MAPKSSSIPLESLFHEIRTHYRSDPSKSAASVERLLDQRLKGCPLKERLVLLEKLSEKFKGVSSAGDVQRSPESGELSRLVSLMLGEEISVQDLSSGECLEKLALCLNTVFDAINQIVGVIHTTLLGKKEELETIRLIIGSDLGGSDLGKERRSDSLKNYLDQIKGAFLVAHQAFRQTANSQITAILNELDPDRIAEMDGGRLEFGPLRKAKLFKIYQERFMKCKAWLDSGRLMEDLLREFEKNFQELFFVAQGRQHEKTP